MDSKKTKPIHEPAASQALVTTFFVTSIVLTLLTTALAILGLVGVPLKEREGVSWTANSDKVSQAEREAYEDTISLFGDHRQYSVLILETDDFFEPKRWMGIEQAFTVLQDEQIAHFIWIGSLPQFSRSKDNLIAQSQIPPWMQPVFQAAIRNQHQVPDLDSSPEQWAKFRENVTSHPLVDGQLLSRDRKTMLVEFYPTDHTEGGLIEIRDKVRAELEPLGFRVRLTGTMPMYNAHRRAFDESHYRVMFIAIALAFVIAIITFRDIRSLLLVGLGPGLGGFWAIGMIHWLGQPRNELTDMILPVMLVMVGFTDAAHLVIDIRHQKARGLAPLASTISALKRVGPACVLTSVTTSISFSTLMLSDSEVISSFGQSSAIAVMVMLIAIILTTPIVAVIIRGPGVTQRMRAKYFWDNDDPIQSPQLKRILRLPSRYPRIITIAGVILTVILGLVASRLQPDDRISDRMPHSEEAWQAFDHCNEAFGGILFIFANIQWPEDATDEDISLVLDEVAQVFEDEELIAAPLTVKDWLHALPLPEDSERTLKMVELLPPDVAWSIWNENERRTLVTGRMQDLGLRFYAPVIEDVDAKFAKIEEQHPGFTIDLTGEPILESRFVGHVIKGLFGSLLTAAAVIFVTLTFAFRSLRLGLISIIPNALPLLAAGALRATFSQSLDIASACAFIIALGIAVDDTIHLIWRFQYEAKRRKGAALIVEKTVLGVGVPLTMTTLIMVSGLATITTSELPTHRFFGWIAATTLTSAYLGDLFLLPAMLTWFWPKGNKADEID